MRLLVATQACGRIESAASKPRANAAQHTAWKRHITASNNKNCSRSPTTAQPPEQRKESGRRRAFCSGMRLRPAATTIAPMPARVAGVARHAPVLLYVSKALER